MEIMARPGAAVSIDDAVTRVANRKDLSVTDRNKLFEIVSQKLVDAKSAETKTKTVTESKTPVEVAPQVAPATPKVTEIPTVPEIAPATTVAPEAQVVGAEAAKPVVEETVPNAGPQISPVEEKVTRGETISAKTKPHKGSIRLSFLAFIVASSGLSFL
jgi:hypothetical protein